jgi:NTP pyrophosphatase (non-canonical NTP hydrolase)
MARLQDLFDLQKVFQRKMLGVELPSHHPELIPITVTSIVGELGEILEENQSWKTWRNNPPPVNEANLRMEVADMWHFVINLSLFLGMDATDVYLEFVKKNKENHARQDRGY